LIGPQRLALPFGGLTVGCVQSRARHCNLNLAERAQQRAAPVAVAVTAGMLRRLRSIVLRRRTPGVARAAERLVELGFEQALQKLTNPIAKASFDRIEPVVEKPLRCLDFRLRQVTSRGIACHGVISAGASTPESLVGPSWRLRRLHFPTTPATAPRALVKKYCLYCIRARERLFSSHKGGEIEAHSGVITENFPARL